VTARCEKAIRRARRLGTKDVGEAKAPASGFEPSGGEDPGAGAAPSFVRAALLAALVGSLLAACGGPARPAGTAPPAPVPRPAAADPGQGVTTELDGSAPSYDDGVLAELVGDGSAAGAAWSRVLAPGTAPAPYAARAALHLAQLDVRAGQSRHALDLIARATTLEPGDAAIEQGAAQVQADIVAASGAGDIRGPKLGSPLPGVAAPVAAAFAAAERALAQVHAIRPRQRLEVWAKEDATEDVVARYRAVAVHGGLVQVAADYRIGSLYHDLALGLLFYLPSGLDQTVAADLLRTLHARALADLKRATTYYRQCLAGPATPDAELWRLAAETDLRSARAVLGEAGEGGGDGGGLPHAP
jgi:hypothetical protein